MERGRGKPSHLGLVGKVDPLQAPGYPLSLGPSSQALPDLCTCLLAAAHPLQPPSRPGLWAVGPNPAHTTPHWCSWWVREVMMVMVSMWAERILLEVSGLGAF